MSASNPKVAVVTASYKPVALALLLIVIKSVPEKQLDKQVSFDVKIIQEVKKHTTARIRMWSPTILLTGRRVA